MINITAKATQKETVYFIQQIVDQHWEKQRQELKAVAESLGSLTWLRPCQYTPTQELHSLYVSPLKVISTLSSKYHHHGHRPQLRTRTVMFPDFHALSVAVHIFLFSTAVSQFTSGPLAFLGGAS